MALQGSLSDFNLEEVIQSIATGKKSGKLEVVGKMGVYGVFFDMGNVIHAFGPYSIGEDAIKDVFLESEGNFVFRQNLILPPRSIFGNVFDIVTDGMILREELRDTVAKLSKTGKINVSNSPDSGEIELSEYEWKLLRYIIEQKTVTEILERTGITFIAFVRVIKKLSNKNMISLGGK